MQGIQIEVSVTDILDDDGSQILDDVSTTFDLNNKIKTNDGDMSLACFYQLLLQHSGG